MPTEQAEFRGTSIKDRHTHYEVHAHIGPEPVSVEIPGYVADDFKEKYEIEITKAGDLRIAGEFVRNDQLVAECQDPFRSPSYRKAVVKDINDISVVD